MVPAPAGKAAHWPNTWPESDSLSLRAYSPEAFALLQLPPAHLAGGWLEARMKLGDTGPLMKVMEAAHRRLLTQAKPQATILARN